MNTLFKILLLIIFMTSGIAFGAENSPDIALTNPMHDSAEITGTVVSLDRGGNRVRLRDGSGNVSEYKVDASTKFMNGQKPSTFGEVTAGSRATLAYNTSTMTVDKFNINTSY